MGNHILKVALVLAAMLAITARADESYDPQADEDRKLSERTDIPIWIAQLATDRVMYRLCLQMYKITGSADRKCKYLLEYPPRPKGICTINDVMNKEKHCWSPTFDSDYEAIGR